MAKQSRVRRKSGTAPDFSSTPARPHDSSEVRSSAADLPAGGSPRGRAHGAAEAVGRGQNAHREGCKLDMLKAIVVLRYAYSKLVGAIQRSAKY